jgi:hypothetical protein
MIAGNTTLGWLTTTMQSVAGTVVSDQYVALGGLILNLALVMEFFIKSSVEMEFFVKSPVDMTFHIVPGGVI